MIQARILYTMNHRDACNAKHHSPDVSLFFSERRNKSRNEPWHTRAESFRRFKLLDG